ncbi:hypothetical protein CYMTET_8033, partial [Cymbomonas tetramitiformis]
DVAGKFEGPRITLEGVVEFVEAMVALPGADMAQVIEDLSFKAETAKRAKLEKVAEEVKQTKLVAAAFEEGVLEVNDTTFENMTSNVDAAVMYHSESCAQCALLQPLWTQLAQSTSAEGSDLRVLRLFATENRKNPGAQFAFAYPTCIFFHNGQPVSVQQGGVGSSGVEDVRQWMTRVAKLSEAEMDLEARALTKGLAAKQEMQRRAEQERLIKLKKAQEEEKRKTKLEERKTKRKGKRG